MAPLNVFFNTEWFIVVGTVGQKKYNSIFKPQLSSSRMGSGIRVIDSFLVMTIMVWVTMVGRINKTPDELDTDLFCAFSRTTKMC